MEDQYTLQRSQLLEDSATLWSMRHSVQRCRRLAEVFTSARRRCVLRESSYLDHADYKINASSLSSCHNKNPYSRKFPKLVHLTSFKTVLDHIFIRSKFFQPLKPNLESKKKSFCFQSDITLPHPT